ncbi:MAG: hypothetical protein U9N77_13680 [Thermodesulfobacteriota bacterium]|nr:hypothetical protein [Thermodesulfobacteriota bacterium]
MDTGSYKKSGFVLRFLTLLPLTSGFLFFAIVIIDNNEIQKILPATPFRTLSLMFIYIATLMTYNYILGIKGDNLMEWKIESSIILAFGFVFAAFFLPFGFPLEVEKDTSFIKSILGFANIQKKPDWFYLFLLLPATGFFIYGFYRLKTQLFEKQQTFCMKIERVGELNFDSSSPGRHKTEALPCTHLYNSRPPEHRYNNRF